MWGTWFDATVHYAENFENICSILKEFDSNDSDPTTILQHVFKDENEWKMLKKLSWPTFKFSVAVFAISSKRYQRNSR